MKPFTYIIGWSKHQKFYYGARWAKDCSPEDLWTTYFTSSKHVKSFREMHGEPDIVEVRKVFDTVTKCRLHENKCLRRLKVLTKDTWLNKNINGAFLPLTQTDEHKRNRVASFKKTMNGRPTFTKGKHSKESIAKMRLAQLGKPKSPEHIESMKKRPQNTQQLTCPHCLKHGDFKNMLRWHMDRCRHKS
jgi:hypothetical protein